MKEISNNTILKIGDHLLWINQDHRLEFFGKFSITTILSVEDDIFRLKFPDNMVPQIMDRDSVLGNCKLLNKDEDAEYYL